MLCNMDYLGHLVAFRDLDLRSNFEVDLLWLTYRYMIRFVSTRQTRWLMYDYFAVLVPWRPQFWPERKNSWSTFLLFFLTTFQMPLSACLRHSGAVLDGDGYPPPPPGRLCHNRSTGSARVNIDILLGKLIKPEKTKILILNWPVTSSVTSKSNPYTVRRVHVRRAIA